MLVTLADYKNYLNLGAGTVKLTFLTNTQNEVEAKVLARLKRDLVSATYVEYYDGNGNNSMNTYQFPITSVTKIEIYQGLVNNVDTWLTWAKGNEYQRLLIDKKVAIKLDGGFFPKGNQNIRITYVAGYATIPYPIQTACKELFKLYYEKTTYGANNLGVLSTSTSVNGGNTNSIRYDENAEEKILQKIDCYARLDI